MGEAAGVDVCGGSEGGLGMGVGVLAPEGLVGWGGGVGGVVVVGMSGGVVWISGGGKGKGAAGCGAGARGGGGAGEGFELGEGV